MLRVTESARAIPYAIGNPNNRQNIVAIAAMKTDFRYVMAYSLSVIRNL